MNTDRFSREYIFYECNTRGHCLGLTLNTPIQLEGKSYTQIYVISVEPNDEDKKESLIKNCATQIDSYGQLNVLAFMDGVGINDSTVIEIDTAKIDEIQIRYI